MRPPLAAAPAAANLDSVFAGATVSPADARAANRRAGLLVEGRALAAHGLLPALGKKLPEDLLERSAHRVGSFLGSGLTKTCGLHR